MQISDPLLAPIPAQNRQAAHHHLFSESSCTGHSSRDVSATSGLDKGGVPHTAYNMYCLGLCRRFATFCPRKFPAPCTSWRPVHDTGPSPVLLLRPLPRLVSRLSLYYWSQSRFISVIEGLACLCY